MDALCNENDVSQLWIIRKPTRNTRPNGYSIEDDSVYSGEERSESSSSYEDADIY